MIDGAPIHELDAALLRIVADPCRLGSFYEMIRGYCHKARNHLNTINLSLFLARKDPPGGDAGHWDEVSARYRAVEELFDRLQDVCRPMALSRMRVPMGALLEEKRAAWAGELGAQGLTLEIEGPCQAVPVEVDLMRLTHALDTLVLARSRRAAPGSTIRLAWRPEPCRIVLEYAEAAPAGAASPEDVRPLTLAIPLLARVAAEHGGALAATPGEPLRLRLEIPTATGAAPA